MDLKSTMLGVFYFTLSMYSKADILLSKQSRNQMIKSKASNITIISFLTKYKNNVSSR